MTKTIAIEDDEHIFFLHKMRIAAFSFFPTMKGKGTNSAEEIEPGKPVEC